MPLLALGAALSLLAAAPASADDVPRGAGNAHEAHGHVESAAAEPGADLVGRPAPAWSFERWIGTAPLSLESLRGKVVLVRWWTDGCRYCAATLPALETLRARHARDGLVVIGAYHPKPPRAVSDRRILAFAARLGFDGPIAVDGEWSTLERYWLAPHPESGWTSVSFLIDRDGIIRWVHGGGEYHPSSDPAHARCDLEYHGLERAVAAALAAPAAARTMQ
ncbi:MAG TPA: redoxin domain-containing protein [Candidatus Eisenbacteria bacterium]|jgi:peroxiredoxin